MQDIKYCEKCNKEISSIGYWTILENDKIIILCNECNKNYK
jgi:ribosomal protein L33